MMQWTSCSRPASVMTPAGVIRPSGSLTSSAGDRVADELDVGSLQSGQIVRAEEHALATEGVVRPDLRSQLGVAHLPAHERGGARAADPPPGARVADHQRQRLAVPE